MPIYRYKCGKCGREFERLKNVLEKEEALKCSDCGSKDLKKLFSTFSVGKSSPDYCDTPECSGCSGGTCPYGT